MIATRFHCGEVTRLGRSMSWLSPADFRCIRRFRSIPGSPHNGANPAETTSGMASHRRGFLFIFCGAGDAALDWLRRPSNRNNRSCRTMSKSPSCKSDSRRSLRPSWQAVAALLGSRRRSSGADEKNGRHWLAQLSCFASFARRFLNGRCEKEQERGHNSTLKVHFPTGLA